MQTGINFAGREQLRLKLGPGGNGEAKGLFVHPQLAAEAEAVLGLVGAQIWTRPAAKAGNRKRRPPSDKESRRWLTGAERAAAVLAGAAEVTVVGDRESDIYHLFAHCPAGIGLIVRAAQDRALEDGERLFAALGREPALAEILVRVPSRGPGDKGRTARLA